MPAVSVAGAAFSVTIGLSEYTSQVTSGTVNTAPTITRTKTLDDVAFDQTDLNSTISVDFLYDENSGLYDALQTSIAAGSSLAVEVASASGTWTGSAMYPESLDMTFDATGVATCSLSLTGSVTFA
jgi:hypothetical protein